MGSKTPHYGEPKFRRLEELRDFTDNFSVELGRGSYGIVYKGIDDEKKEIAVKVLDDRTGSMPEHEFEREFKSLLKVINHQNIIQLVGYCYETEQKYNSVLKKREPITRAILCFEYASKGNVGKYMSDNGDKLDWSTCYKIIKGTCEGLCYLHNLPSGSAMWHLDLKPENILLNHDMVPKIADFGLSKLTTDVTSKATVNPVGTWRYTPLEFKLKQKISKEFDIYSLGIIILEIIVGTKTYAETDDFSQEDANRAFEKWKPKLSPVSYEQVKKCLEIALKCVVVNRVERPQMQNIIDDLSKVENMTLEALVSHREKSKSEEVQKDNTIGSSMTQDKDVRRQTATYGSSSHIRRTGDQVILYITTASSIKKTLNECNTIRAALQSHNVDFIEKDLFERPDNLRELKKLLAGTKYKLPVPVLSINGSPVCDARQLLELNSKRRLPTLFD